MSLQQAERNKAMFMDWLAGHTFADVARQHGISVERVRQIVAKEARIRRARNPGEGFYRVMRQRGGVLGEGYGTPREDYGRAGREGT